MRPPLLAALALGLGLTLLPVTAQSGFVLFGPKSSEQVLNYYISNNRAGAQLINYTFYLKTQKVAVRQVQILLDDSYAESFDSNSVELVNNDSGTVFALDLAQVDTEGRTLTIAAKEPIPAGVPLAVKLSNATNPRAPGIHRLRARVMGTEPNPIFRFIGDWFVSLN
jgi:Protein of unknown function (DUF2808)